MSHDEACKGETNDSQSIQNMQNEGGNAGIDDSQLSSNVIVISVNKCCVWKCNNLCTDHYGYCNKCWDMLEEDGYFNSDIDDWQDDE